MGIYYWKGKPLFVGGKIAFSAACCCNVPCTRVVFLVYIGGEGTFTGAEPSAPPLRSGYGTSRYMYQAYSVDDLSSPPGSAYKNLVWTIEFCYDEYDIDPADNKFPTESYEDELEVWACAAQNTWMGSESCYVEVSIVDDPYAAATYTTIQNSTRLNMDSLVGAGNWTRTDVQEPVLLSHCPDCICSYSCIPDGK